MAGAPYASAPRPNAKCPPNTMVTEKVTQTHMRFTPDGCTPIFVCMADLVTDDGTSFVVHAGVHVVASVTDTHAVVVIVALFTTRNTIDAHVVVK
jgi:hypothetical protein